MNLILVHDSCAVRDGGSLLRFALTAEPLRGIVLRALSEGPNWSPKNGRNRYLCSTRGLGKTICAVPRGWGIGPWPGSGRKRRSDSGAGSQVIRYDSAIPLGSEVTHEAVAEHGADSWFRVSNSRFVTRIDGTLLEGILRAAVGDLVAVNAKPGLCGAQEIVRLTTDHHVAGFRRLYSDSAEFAFAPADWPHHLFIRAGALPRLLVGGTMPVSFADVSLRCQSQGLALRAIDVGGAVLDLETEEGMLGLCDLMLSSDGGACVGGGNSPLISPGAKLAGHLLLGEDVEIGPEAVIVGPTVVARGAKIERGAVVSASIIGEQVRVPQGQFVRNCIAQGPDYDWTLTAQRRGSDSHLARDLNPWQTTQGAFRNWPWFSYARCFKRVADFLAALMVLVLFAPVMPFVALAIRLTSPGPVFYSDKRQGLHGKEFGCLKFRTMVAGANKIQDKLRFVSQVDGPQFKMDDDPRISTVGRFLRETYIDEIPQFFNVLFGQMSIVGPRPSPESENTLCPPWRDARLSVRPGITGLWQLHRTREPMRDFQEWIHYDTMYVRNLSLKMDLVTCWRTAMKLLDNFISQF